MNKENRTLRESLKLWRDSHLLLADALITLAVVGTFLGAAMLAWSPSAVIGLLQGSRAAAYGTLASIFGSLLGFVLAAVSVISVFGDSPRFDPMRNQGRFHQIFDIFFYATYLLAFGTVWSLFALVLDSDQRPNAVITTLSIGVLVLAIASVYRCIWILRVMIQITNEPIRHTQPTQ